MLPERHRLKSRGSFRAVQTRGRKFVGRTIVVRAVRTSESRPSRFGFSVSDRVGNAVVRNTVKRRLREAVREVLPECAVALDVVMTARNGAQEASYDQLRSDVRQAIGYLCRQCGQPANQRSTSTGAQ